MGETQDRTGEGSTGAIELSEDRNKTPLTHEITKAASLWLDERGFKPVETEVAVDRGWVADIASVISPTQTELQKLRLLPSKPSWKSEKYQVWQDKAATLLRLMTVLVEVKTSRGDFLSDHKRTKASPADLSYLAFPAGLIKSEEIPTGWGALEYYENAGLRCIRPAVPQDSTKEQQLSIVYEVAVRRDHRTRYEAQREWRKQDLVERNREKSLTRVRDACKVALEIACGAHDSIEDALRYHRIKNAPQWFVESLEAMWNIAPEKRELLPTWLQRQIQTREQEKSEARNKEWLLSLSSTDGKLGAGESQ